jgi:hypothetical protein
MEPETSATGGVLRECLGILERGLVLHNQRQRSEVTDSDVRNGGSNGG